MRHVLLLITALALSAQGCGPPRELRGSIKLMESDDPEERLAGAYGLRKKLAEQNLTGLDAAVPVLLTVTVRKNYVVTLDSGRRTSTREEALAVLDQIPVETLLPYLTSEDLGERSGAISALERRGDPRAVEPLIELLNDSSLRRKATSALGAIGDPRAIPALLALIDDPELDYLVIEALGHFKDPAVADALVDVLEETESDLLMMRAARSLSETGGDARATGALVAVLAGPGLERFRRARAKSDSPWTEDDERSVREVAARCLGAEAFRQPSVIEALIDATDDPEFGVKAAASTSLEKLTDAGPADTRGWRRWWRDHRATYE